MRWGSVDKGRARAYRLVRDAEGGGQTTGPGSEGTSDVEVYTDERLAEFLLNNAVDLEDYLAACEAVRRLGLDPEAIPHDKPRVYA